MRETWDRFARKDPYWFVDNRLDYGRPDTDRFWAGGGEDLDELFRALAVELAPADRAVEIGCGIGRLTRAIAARCDHVVAVDVSPEMIARAKELNAEIGNVSWVVGDGETLAAVPDASADACISHVVFQHIPDPAITLGYVREMGRVLRPGGWAAFQVSTDPSVHVRRDGTSLLRRLLGRGPSRSDIEDPAWLGSAVELEQLHAVAVEAGLETEKTIGAGTQFCGVRLRRASY